MCITFREFGYCRYGFKCRYAGDHTRLKEDDGTLYLLKDEERTEKAKSEAVELNAISNELMKQLRKKEVSPYLHSRNCAYYIPEVRPSSYKAVRTMDATGEQQTCGKR